MLPLNYIKIGVAIVIFAILAGVYLEFKRLKKVEIDAAESRVAAEIAIAQKDLEIEFKDKIATEKKLLQMKAESDLAIAEQERKRVEVKSSDDVEQIKRVQDKKASLVTIFAKKGVIEKNREIEELSRVHAQ